MGTDLRRKRRPGDAGGDPLLNGLADPSVVGIADYVESKDDDHGQGRTGCGRIADALAVNESDADRLQMIANKIVRMVFLCPAIILM